MADHPIGPPGGIGPPGPIGPKPPSSYTMTAAYGSFALTGEAALFQPRITTSYGSFALTGEAALFQINSVVAQASFSFTGEAALFQVDFVLGVGSFALTGEDTILSAPGTTESFSVDYGSFRLTGHSALVSVQSTILSDHKVDPPQWRAGAISRSRYKQYKEQWRIDGLNAQRELARKRRAEQKDLGFRKIEYDKYGYQIDSGDALYHAFLRDFEAQQVSQAVAKLSDYHAGLAAQMGAIDQFHRHAAMTAQMARMQQFARDTAEEKEALELMEMDD